MQRRMQHARDRKGRSRRHSLRLHAPHPEPAAAPDARGRIAQPATSGRSPRRNSDRRPSLIGAELTQSAKKALRLGNGTARSSDAIENSCGRPALLVDYLCERGRDSALSVGFLAARAFSGSHHGHGRVAGGVRETIAEGPPLAMSVTLGAPRDRSAAVAVPSARGTPRQRARMAFFGTLGVHAPRLLMGIASTLALVAVARKEARRGDGGREQPSIAGQREPSCSSEGSDARARWPAPSHTERAGGPPRAAQAAAVTLLLPLFPKFPPSALFFRTVAA